AGQDQRGRGGRLLGGGVTAGSHVPRLAGYRITGLSAGPARHRTFLRRKPAARAAWPCIAATLQGRRKLARPTTAALGSRDARIAGAAANSRVVELSEHERRRVGTTTRQPVS